MDISNYRVAPLLKTYLDANASKARTHPRHSSILRAIAAAAATYFAAAAASARLVGAAVEIESQVEGDLSVP